MRDDFRQPDEVKARFEPWPWAIAGVLLTFVAVQVFLVSLAGRHFEGPDESNYYKMGLNYDNQMARHRQGWHVVSNLPHQIPAGQPLQLSAIVVDRQGKAVAGKVTAHFGRPATKSQDSEVALPGSWTPLQGWWDVTYSIDGETLDEVRIQAQ